MSSSSCQPLGALPAGSLVGLPSSGTWEARPACQRRICELLSAHTTENGRAFKERRLMTYLGGGNSKGPTEPRFGFARGEQLRGSSRQGLARQLKSLAVLATSVAAAIAILSVFAVLPPGVLFGSLIVLGAVLSLWYAKRRAGRPSIEEFLSRGEGEEVDGRTTGQPPADTRRPRSRR